MATPVIQTSFHAGEWAPALNARVDLAKYHSAAALLKNFFVDYRGGASTRMGTKYVLQARVSDKPVRLVQFQASQNVGYVLEFGEFYIRFYFQGAPILESSHVVTNAAALTILEISSGTVPVPYSVGDWIQLNGIVGGNAAKLNGRYFIIRQITGVATFTLNDLFGNAVDGTLYTGYVSGGTYQRVYTIPSPYAGADLALLKFAQNVNRMVICHPDYAPRELLLVSATNWTITQITFGTTIQPPTGMGAATSSAGVLNFSYLVTSVDVNGQESTISSVVTITANIAGATLTITWTGASGAVAYNVYRAGASTAAVMPAGSAFGYVNTVTGLSYVDIIGSGSQSLNPADYSETPPIARNPFLGGSLASITITAAGTYTSVPTVSIAAPSSGVTATAGASLGVQGTPTVVGQLTVNNLVGDSIIFPNGVILIVATAAGVINTFQPITFPGANHGSITSGSTPTNPVTGVNARTGLAAVTANLTWGVQSVGLTNAGTGYTSAPAVTFSSGAATATAVLSTVSAGNPTVPTFFNQRLVLAGPEGSPQQFNMSQPGRYYNYNVSRPTQPDDAIEATLVSGILNEIKAMIPMPSGLIILTNRAGWLVYGTTPGTPVSAVDTTAQAQAYIGANDVPPIVANQEILFVQAKGSSIRNVSYSFYQNVFTGTDISVLSSHLFFGFEILEWAWAEEPFKIVWAIRDDGTLLSLTFLKEQDLIGWTHHDTEGEFKSVACVTEEIEDEGFVDATYFVVEREVNGNTVKYIERMADRFFTSVTDPGVWCVDSGLQYDGAPATSFTGGEHLAGLEVTGLADGEPITPFTMATTGFFTLPEAASVVTVGLAYSPQLQTLPIDLGNPTVQGKMKMIPSVTVRCQQTLGLQIGSTFATVVDMKDLVIGNVGSATSELVTDLVTGDAMTNIDSRYTVPGQYCIQQPLPYPATILGVIPEITVGDTVK